MCSHARCDTHAAATPHTAWRIQVRPCVCRTPQGRAETAGPLLPPLSIRTASAHEQRGDREPNSKGAAPCHPACRLRSQRWPLASHTPVAHLLHSLGRPRARGLWAARALAHAPSMPSNHTLNNTHGPPAVCAPSLPLPRARGSASTRGGKARRWSAGTEGSGRASPSMPLVSPPGAVAAPLRDPYARSSPPSASSLMRRLKLAFCRVSPGSGAAGTSSSTIPPNDR